MSKNKDAKIVLITLAINLIIFGVFIYFRNFRNNSSPEVYLQKVVVYLEQNIDEYPKRTILYNGKDTLYFENLKQKYPVIHLTHLRSNRMDTFLGKWGTQMENLIYVKDKRSITDNYLGLLLDTYPYILKEKEFRYFDLIIYSKHESPKKANLLYQSTNTFEDSINHWEYASAKYIHLKNSNTGEKSYKFSEDRLFGHGFTFNPFNLNRASLWITAQCEYSGTVSGEALLVIEYRQGNKLIDWKPYRLAKRTRDAKPSIAYNSYLIKQTTPNDEVKVYVWNSANNQELLLDNFNIKFFEK